MSDIREAEQALRAIHRLDPGVPVLVSLTFDRNRRGVFTVMGDPLIESLWRLEREGAEVVGANCTMTSGEMRGLIDEAMERFSGRLVFQPNAGLPRVSRRGVHYEQDPAEFARDLCPAIERGVAALGGCCGTSPEFISALGLELGQAGELETAAPGAPGNSSCRSHGEEL